jgi:hypothetical protein
MCKHGAVSGSKHACVSATVCALTIPQPFVYIADFTAQESVVVSSTTAYEGYLLGVSEPRCGSAASAAYLFPKVTHAVFTIAGNEVCATSPQASP